MTTELGSIIKELSSKKFESKPFADDDVFTWYFEDAESYNEYVNPWLSLHRAFADNRIVGISIRPVDRIKEALGE